MTEDEPQLTERQKWIALALLATTQFVIILDAAIVNVAIPSIGKDLKFATENLAWIPNAYALTFGGFLLLGGRMADLLGRRRLFMYGLGVFGVSSLMGGFSGSEETAHRLARRPGPRRGAARPVGAVDGHEHVQRGRGAQQGAGRVGRRVGLRRCRGRAARRRADRVRRLGVGAVGQRPDRHHRRVPRAAAARREPGRVRDAPLRRARRGHGHGRPLAARLRARRHRPRGLGLDPDARPAGDLARAHRARSSSSSGARSRRSCRSGSSACARSRARTSSACSSARRCSRCSSSSRATCRRCSATTR